MHHPFALDEVVALDGTPTALLQSSNKLFVGFSDGALRRYSLTSGAKADDTPKATLESSVAGLGRGPSTSTASASIDSLGLIKETNSLAVLAGGDVALYDLSTLELQTACQRWTKGQAGSMWADTSVLRQDERGIYAPDVHRERANGSASPRRQSSMAEPNRARGDTSSPSRFQARLGRLSKAASVVEMSSPASVYGGVPVLLTTLAVPCRRRLLLFSWKDGEWSEPREVWLPHQPRSLCFPSPLKIFLGYSTGDYATLALPATLSATTQPVLSDPFPPPVTVAVGTATTSTVRSDVSQSSAQGSTTGSGFSAGLTGLATRTGNLVSLGLGAGGKVSRNPVVRVGNRQGEVIGVKEGLATFMTSEGRLSRPAWSVPGITYPSPPEEMAVAGPFVVASLPGKLQVNSIPTLALAQTIELPPMSVVGDTADASNRRQSLPPMPPPRLLTPSANGKTPVFFSVAMPQGSRLYMLSMKAWSVQADELVASGDYDEALALLADVDLISLPDKPERMSKLEALAAVRSFGAGDFEGSIDTFIDLDTNPAKVVALYPERVSGKFAKPREEWEELFGGRARLLAKQTEDPAVAENGRSASPKPSSGSGGQQDEDAASVRSATSLGVRAGPLRPKGSKRSLRKPVDDFRVSVDHLVRFLTDRRQNVNKALSSVATPLAKLRAETRPTSVEELFAIPSVPMAQLSELELALVAQVVDTALFRCYLAMRPSMLGPLCRLDNWCQVDEVEALLMEAKRYHELLDLYHGKGLHDRALSLLKTMSEEEDDVDERLQPTIRYLQKLGPDHLDLILSTAQWVLAADRSAGLEIFTADLGAVESLPRHAVARHLERTDPLACIGYLEHLVGALGEQGPDLHEKLAGLYISQSARGSDEVLYGKLLVFLRNSTQYSPEWVIARLPGDAMHEARALTLGRMGRHEAALSIYVHRLDDFATAEEYCTRVYAESPDDKGAVFLVLLRLLLRPEGEASAANFEAALRLIANQGARIDASAVLDLLPPLVRLSDAASFLRKALRESSRQARELRLAKEVGRARLDQLERAKMGLDERRVKIDAARSCTACGKRFGNSVIAVHSPSGEVTHYQCRDRIRPTFARHISTHT